MTGPKRDAYKTGLARIAPGPAASRGSGRRALQGRIALLVIPALLSGCSFLSPRLILDRPGDIADAPKQAPAPRGGGYYKDDGPGENPPDMAAIPEPEPRVEPLHRFANNPYQVFGTTYTPLKSLAPFKQRGLGSWYGRKFHGQKTSSGEVYDMYGMTAAHPTLPIPSYARVTSLANGKSVIVRINDRGPFHPGRVVDLSYTAAWKLGYVAAGSTSVEVELLTPDHIAALRHGGPEKAIAMAQTSPPAADAAQAQHVALAETTLPMDVQMAGVFLQLAAFSARDNAEAFRARLYRELHWLTEGIHILQQGGLFRLHVGPYRDRNEAGGVAERIRSALQLTPLIVVR